MAGGRGLTCRRDDHFGPAAGEAVQQGFGPDVKVEQSHRAAQFGQAEPSPHEAGLVGQEEGDRVPLLQPGCSLQSSGYLVALSVHMAVRIFPTFEEQEGLAGMLLCSIQEAVHDAVERLPLLVLGEPDAEHDAPQNVHAVGAEMREKFAEKHRQRNRKSGEEAEPHVHLAAREETCVRPDELRASSEINCDKVHLLRIGGGALEVATPTFRHADARLAARKLVEATLCLARDLIGR